MRKILIYLLVYFLKFIMAFRYRVYVKGYDKLTPETLNKPGGVLFLPNHPAVLVDPVAASLAVFLKFPIRPLIVEYMYYTPIVYGMMRFLKALPIPNFETSNNSLKRKRHEKVLDEVIKGLKNGENFLLYPAGRLKHTCKEKIGGASATHRIITETPEANIILVRVKGLWGSSFSRALTGNVPPMFPTLKHGFWVLLKNLIFFAPRRKVIIELVPAPANFPYHPENRLELNHWLEKWYNQPDGLSEQEGPLPGDSLIQTSYSFWKKDIPEVYKPEEIEETVVHLKDIDHDLQDKVLDKLQELTEINPSAIKPEMSLANDLGLDSLDISELAMFIQDYFETGPIPVTEMTTVRRVIGIASGKIKVEEKVEETQFDISKWSYTGKSDRAQIGEGKTIPEVFLNICGQRGKAPAYADARSGILPYSRLKLGAILLAEHIRHLPGKYIGILLPASVGAFISVLACQLAGKVPLMINWTIGPRHLKAVSELSKVEVILSSWAFLERLDSVDLTGIDEKLLMLETVRHEFSIVDKIRALIRSKKSTKNIMKTFGIDKTSEDDAAVLLFTSGTESMPKGVPLSHSNILENQRAALETVNIRTDDVILSFLPPFHSFGFCITGLIGLLGGARTAFFPNPTDGKGLAKASETWGATIICGAPTFVKAMLKAATLEQVKNMRYCITGAEATPPDLFDLLRKFDKENTHVEGYGITECSPMISTNIANVNGKDVHLKGVGRPVPGVELIVVHPETNEVLPVGAEGLILTRGPNVFSGYLNPGLASPFLTVEGKEWYNTGDIGFLDEDGCLTISGRKKRFIKAGGEMVSLQAIETALLQAAPKKKWPLSEEGPSLGVIAKEVPGGKPTFMLVTTFSTDVDEVNQTLRDSGFSNMIKVSKVIKLEEIPIMGTGKTNFRVLEEQYIK
ncbi:MAG: Bifunctional protein Aas [Chlamydiae bacterium]|nr:Bifunctional protein Aas [Chlamydiota bacterium]